MCSYIVMKARLRDSSAKGPKGWMSVDTAHVYYDHPAHAPLDRSQKAAFSLRGSDIDTHGTVLYLTAGPDYRKSDPVRGIAVVRADKDSTARRRSEQRDPLYSWDRPHGWSLLL